VERATGGGRAVRVITAVNADAAGLADTIEAVFSDATETSPAPIVRVDRESNSLIVRGSAEQLSRIEQLVGEIDEASLASSRDLRTIRVDPIGRDGTVRMYCVRAMRGRSWDMRIVPAVAGRAVEAPVDADVAIVNAVGPNGLTSGPAAVTIGG